MPETITAIYENGVLRPLTPLPLQEHQTVQIQILPEDSATQLERISQSLAAAGLVTPPPHQNGVEPVCEATWQELTEKLRAIPGKPLLKVWTHLPTSRQPWTKLSGISLY